MAHAADGDGEFARLADRVASAPDDVSVGALVAALQRDPPDDPDRAKEAFTSLAAADPAAVSAAVDALAPLVTDDACGPAAGVALSALANEYPGRAKGAAQPLCDLAKAEDKVYARKYAFHGLESLAAEHPSALDPAVVPVLRSNLSGDTFERKGPALAVTAELARQDPAIVASLSPLLVEQVTIEKEFGTEQEYFEELPDQLRSQLQEDEVRWMRLRMIAALTLVEVARVDPDAVVEAALTLVDRLDEESNLTVREATYDLVWLVGQERPGAVSAAIEPFAERLRAEADPEIRGKVARALGMLADDERAAVVGAVEPAMSVVYEMLDADEPVARAGATGLLSYVAEAEPDRVEPVASRLQELAVDGPTYVRGNAIWSLAYVGGEDAAETLRELADSADDEDIRALATEACRRLDS
ncbi:MAG: HEAT repeat domain-containing protein [Haloplanus sp.]